MNKQYIFDPTSIPFARRAGVELTWHAPKLPKRITGTDRDETDEEVNGHFAEIIQTYHAKKGVNVFDAVINDPGCVEIPSPILYSWKDLTKFWNYWEPICEGYGLTRIAEESTGGGGHIHIDATEWEQIKVCRDIASRPYLSWVFLHPSDDINGCTIAHWMSDRSSNDQVPPKWMQHGLTEKGWKSRETVTNRWGVGPMRENGFFSKDSVVCMSERQGLEFRAFTGAEDLQEQYRHMAFVQRYMDWVVKNPVANVPWNNGREARIYLETWKDYDKCELAFMDLILDLGLDPNAYIEYPETWLKGRFRKGMGRFI